MKDLLLRFYKHLKAEQNQETSKHQEVICKKYCQKIISTTTNVYSLLNLYVSTFSTMEVDVAVMSPVSNSIISFINVLCEFFVEIKSQEKSMEKVLKPVFIVESTHPYVYEMREPVTVVCKGAESFKITYSGASKFPPMDFMKGIKAVDPSTNKDLHRISSETASGNWVFESKDEIKIEFEYSDLKKLRLEYLIGHPV